MLRLSALLAWCLLPVLAGCGQKGGLYLPDPAPPTLPAAPAAPGPAATPEAPAAAPAATPADDPATRRKTPPPPDPATAQ